MIFVASLAADIASPLSAALPILVALIAINAVVDIARHLVMLEIVRVISAMTSGALEDGVIIGIRVAGRADSARVAMTGWERRVLGMVKCRPGPGRCVVAGLTSRREELRLRRMAGIRRVVVVGLMTSDACCRQRRVVIVDVAVGALPRRHRMRSGQRECRVVVIECGIGPDRRVVAQLTCGRETCGRVSGIVGARVIRLVTRVAQSAVQRIVIVLMAITALPRWHRMRTG